MKQTAFFLESGGRQVKRMPNKAIFNILMYSHDTYGLGHIRRTLAIASHLRGVNVNILILTGSPIAGRFKFPDRVDFVRIPGMIKKTNEEYLPLSIKIDAVKALDIRKNIITATAQTFQPHMFIVDKEPLGLKKEVLPTLEWFRREMPETRTILGLRDIMDDAETVCGDWQRRGIYDILDALYTEVWIYGIRDFYDPIAEYEIPEKVCPKIHFTGYIPRKKVETAAKEKLRREHRIDEQDRLVVVTTGGGGDGYAVMESYLAMMENRTPPAHVKSILVTGPFMPEGQRRKISKRARLLGIKTYRFYRRMEDLMAAADLVVSMGGYNTTCEILTQGTVSLLIPRETPRREQLIRARVFKERNLVDYIAWKDLDVNKLHRKMTDLLQNPEPYQKAIASFQMTAYEVMHRRLSVFQQQPLQHAAEDYLQSVECR